MDSWDLTFIKVATLMAKHSTCVRKQVGVVIVKNNRIISTGYNGVPSGMKHCNEVFTKSAMAKLTDAEFYKQHGDFSAKYEVHAEQNAIAELSKNEVNAIGATLVTTLSPCSNCAKLIAAAGIKRVVYLEEYDRDTNGPDLLKNLGIECIKFDEPL